MHQRERSFGLSVGGVLLVLSLIALRYVDEAALAERTRWFVRLAFPTAAVMLPLACLLLLDKSGSMSGEPIRQLNQGAGFVVVTEEALATADLTPLAGWIGDQQDLDTTLSRGKVAVRLGPVALTLAGHASFEEIDPERHAARVKARPASASAPSSVASTMRCSEMSNDDSTTSFSDGGVSMIR